MKKQYFSVDEKARSAALTLEGMQFVFEELREYTNGDGGEGGVQEWMQGMQFVFEELRERTRGGWRGERMDGGWRFAFAIRLPESWQERLNCCGSVPRCDS